MRNQLSFKFVQDDIYASLGYVYFDGAWIGHADLGMSVDDIVSVQQMTEGGTWIGTIHFSAAGHTTVQVAAFSGSDLKIGDFVGFVESGGMTYAVRSGSRWVFDPGDKSVCCSQKNIPVQGQVLAINHKYDKNGISSVVTVNLCDS